jgi:TRAP-type C4-dicarboxylate transport system substrate-binding protein
MYRILLSALIALFLMGQPAHADEPVVIKLATLAPEGSTWYKALALLGEDWNRVSDGKVQLKIYAGGVTGNETVMLRKMRIGQLHAGAVTNLGLTEIDPSSQVLNIPMFIRDYAELDYVMERLRPDFERRIEEKGYVVLGWSEAGWAHMFSKTPITSTADVGTIKPFVWEGDSAAVAMFKAAGFKPVVLAATDVLPSLQSGLIDSFPSTPLGALALQWFALAPNMLDVKWAPLLGATIVRKDAWEMIPAELRPKLLEVAKTRSSEIKEDIRRQDTKAIAVMQRYGLKVHTVDAPTLAEWEKLGAAARASARGTFVTNEIYDQVAALIEEHRKNDP